MQKKFNKMLKNWRFISEDMIVEESLRKVKGIFFNTHLSIEGSQVPSCQRGRMLHPYLVMVWSEL